MSSAFKLAPTRAGWQLTTLHTFTPDTSDGYKAIGRPVLDSQGNVYGVTNIGGLGWGTAYELSPTSMGPWTEKILYTFTGQADGTFPMGGLSLDAAGNLYGTTYGGGDLNCGFGSGCGTVYKLGQANGNWSETVVHGFSVCRDSGPVGELISDGQGRYYGTTLTSGDQGCTGDGEVFEIKP